MIITIIRGIRPRERTWRSFQSTAMLTSAHNPRIRFCTMSIYIRSIVSTSRLSLKLATTHTEPRGSLSFPFLKTLHSIRMSQFIGDTAAAAKSFAPPQLWDIIQETHYAFKLCETTLGVVPQCPAALHEARLPTRALHLIALLRSSDAPCLVRPLRAHTGLVAPLSLLALLVWASEV